MTAITLCAVPYEVTDADGQVIFDEKSGFAHCYCRFTFEWTGCGWYLVDTDDSHGRTFVPHIIAAYEWVEANYAIAWDNGVGKVSRK